MSEVTVFIEDAAIKLLVARGRRVRKWAKLPLESGLVSEGVILDEDRVAENVKELLKLQGVGDRKVIAGLSGFNSIYRLVSLPELPEAVLPEAVRHEAMRLIPVSLDQVYLSYQPIPSPPGETRFFLVAYPRSTTDALISTLKKAGLDPQVIDLAPLALCRTIDEPRAMVIDVRSASLDIAIMADRVPQIIRSLSLPSEAKTLEESMPTIVEELDRTITFYNSSHLDSPLEPGVPIFVCGDLGAAAETWPSLVGESGYSVSALPSPLQAIEGFDSTQFMVNVGLALKPLSPEKDGAYFSLVNFNALPEIYQRKGTPVSAILIPAGALIGVGLLVLLGIFVRNVGAQTEALQSQLAPVESRIVSEREAIVELTEKIEPMQPQIDALKANADVLGVVLPRLEATRTEVDGDLTGIVGLWPEGMDLAKINHDGNPIKITGLAMDEATIFEYARELRSSGRYYSVIITSITAITEGMVEEQWDEDVIREFDFEFLLLK